MCHRGPATWHWLRSDLILRDAADADLFMEILNSDGSRAQACGNGTRCVAAMVMRETDRESLQINTDGGVLKAWHGENGLVSVDMGPVQMGWQEVPLAREMDTVEVELAAAPGPAVCHSMGNPHAVVFVDDVEAVDLEQIGPAIDMMICRPGQSVDCPPAGGGSVSGAGLGTRCRHHAGMWQWSLRCRCRDCQTWSWRA